MGLNKEQCICAIIEIIKQQIHLNKLLDRYDEKTSYDSSIIPCGTWSDLTKIHIYRGLHHLAEHFNLEIQEKDLGKYETDSEYYINITIDDVEVKIYQLSKKGKYKTKQQKAKMVKQLKNSWRI